MNFSLSFQQKPLGQLELDHEGYNVDAITVVKHRTLLKKVLADIYEHGLEDRLQGDRAVTHTVLPTSKEFLLLLTSRLSLLGYEVA